MKWLPYSSSGRTRKIYKAGRPTKFWKAIPKRKLYRKTKSNYTTKNYFPYRHSQSYKNSSRYANTSYNNHTPVLFEIDFYTRTKETIRYYKKDFLIAASTIPTLCITLLFSIGFYMVNSWGTILCCNGHQIFGWIVAKLGWLFVIIAPWLFFFLIAIGIYHLSVKNLDISFHHKMFQKQILKKQKGKSQGVTFADLERNDIPKWLSISTYSIPIVIGFSIFISYVLCGIFYNFDIESFWYKWYTCQALIGPCIGIAMIRLYQD